MKSYTQGELYYYCLDCRDDVIGIFQVFKSVIIYSVVVQLMLTVFDVFALAHIPYNLFMKLGSGALWLMKHQNMMIDRWTNVCTFL